jgi:hypothetical protein
VFYQCAAAAAAAGQFPSMFKSSLFFKTHEHYNYLQLMQIIIININWKSIYKRFQLDYA